MKTASEVLRRHEQQLRAQLHKEVRVASADGNDELDITLDIVADDIEPYALLTALDTFGEQSAQVQVAPSFSSARRAPWPGSKTNFAARARGGAGRLTRLIQKLLTPVNILSY